jgi:hypothetical protein
MNAHGSATSAAANAARLRTGSAPMRAGNGSPGHSPTSGPPGDRFEAGNGRPVRRAGFGLLAVASGLLLLLAAAQGYVSFRAQYAFVDHAKHARLPSMLEALGLDTGAVIFALLALSLARRGGRATVERTLNLGCAVGSLTMNLLAADLTSPRSVTVWVLPSALYALASDRLIAVVRRWVLASGSVADLAKEGSAWRAIGGLALWILRLLLDVPGTAAGFRRWVLAAAPVAPGIRVSSLPGGEPHSGLSHSGPPELPGNATASGASTGISPSAEGALDCTWLAPGETKREALIRLYESCGAVGDPRYGDRARAALLAGEIAGRIGYHPGTARRELVRYLTSRNDPASDLHTESDSGAEADA